MGNHRGVALSRDLASDIFPSKGLENDDVVLAIAFLSPVFSGPLRHQTDENNEHVYFHEGTVFVGTVGPVRPQGLLTSRVQYWSSLG